MTVGRELAQVVNAHLDEVALARPPEQRRAQRRLEVFGESAEDVDTHADRHR